MVNFGCKKEATIFNISGKVINKQLQENLAGVDIYLDAKKIENGVYNNNFVNVASVVSSSDGSFAIELEESKVSEYRFRISEGGYFGIEEIISTDKIESSSGYKRNFELVQKSWIELNVKNTMPQGTDDKITYRYTNIEVKGKDCCNNIVNTGIGFDFEAHHTCSIRSHAWIRLQWTVTKSGTQVINKDSIFSGNGETVTFSINY